MELLKLERPPVRKVRLAVYFDLVAEIQVSHLAGYIEGLKSTYTDVTERAPLDPWREDDGEGDQVDFLTPTSAWPFPLLVLRDDIGSTVAFQADRMSVTWSFGSSPDSLYPGYEELKKRLQGLLEGYRAAIREAVRQDIVIRRYECFYENHIADIAGYDLALGVLSNWTAPLSDVPSASYAGARLEYRHKEREDNLSTLVAVDSSEDQAIPELWIRSMRDRLDTEENSIDGMDVVHDALIESFRRYTTKGLREGWGEIK